MKVIDANLVKGKRVLVRLDLDVSLESGKIIEDFRLKADIPTITLLAQNVSKVIIIGHLGRPEKEDRYFSLKPVFEWFKRNGFPQMTFLDDSPLVMRENLRFDPREELGDESFAKEFLSLADIYVFEAFAAHRPSVSTTVLPKLMPSFAGLQFTKEVEKLTQVREKPKRPLVAIVGGAKVEDKYKNIESLSRFCDKVLVGGLLSKRIKDGNLPVGDNVIIGELVDSGFDMSNQSINLFKNELRRAKQVIWAGPVGKYEDEKGITGTKDLAQFILESGIDCILGGGDTVSALGRTNLLEKYLQSNSIFVSTGGGAMLKLLSEGTLPTIQALE